MNQSSPRRLCFEGCGFSGGDGTSTIFLLPIAPPLRSPSSPLLKLNGCATRIYPSSHLMLFVQRRQVAGRAEHDDRRVLLVFRRGCHLRLAQFQRDAVALVVDPPEMQRVPVDHNLAAADAEEAAEVDDGGAHRAGAVNDDVDNM